MHRAEACRQLEAGIRGLGLEGCWAWKPLLPGNEVSAHTVRSFAEGVQHMEPIQQEVLGLLMAACCLQVMEITGVKAGPKMGQLTAKLISYQLAHPTASVEDARAFLKSI